MHLTLYRLRFLGKARTYRQVADADRLHGLLAFGAGNGPARVAEISGGGKVLARLLRAHVLRISHGCVLLQGEEDGHAQTWLCAQDERVGEAALRKIRPPTAAEMPLAGFGEEDDDRLD